MTMLTFAPVQFGDAADLGKLVASLQDQTISEWRLVVANNQAERSSEVQGVIPHDASLISHSENLGYLNGAVRALRSCGVDGWAVISNTDVIFEPDFVEDFGALVAEGKAEGVGIIAPAIIDGSGHDQNPFMTTRPSARSMGRRAAMFRFVPLARLVVLAATMRKQRAGKRPPRRKPAGAIYAAHGSCFIIAPELLQSPAIDYPQFLFGEEIFLAEVAKTQGLSVLYAPQLRAAHAEHQSTGVWRTRQVLKWQRDSARANWRRLR